MMQLPYIYQIQRMHVLGAGVQKAVISAGWSQIKTRHTHTPAGPEKQRHRYES